MNFCFNIGGEEFIWFTRYSANWSTSHKRLSFTLGSMDFVQLVEIPMGSVPGA